MAKRIKTSGLILAAVALAASAGCAKKRDYLTLLKDENLPKTAFDTRADYIYVPTVSQADRKAGEVATPAWSGDPKVVRFSFEEKQVVAREVEPDPRYAQNPTNAKPVLAIPVEWKDYRCALNSSDECSNKEEENKDLPWQERTQMKVDFSKLDVKEISLPIDIQSVFIPCYTDIGTNVLSLEHDDDSINIEVEKTYRVGGAGSKASSGEESGCGSNLQSLSDMVFTMRNHYSFVKLKKLASPDYETVNYPYEDQDKFGFFVTEDIRRSADNTSEVSGDHMYLERWNPKRKSMTYTLSDEFNKPENAGIKQASYAAVAAINDGFRRAGVDLKVVLEDPKGYKVGDIRHSMIIAVEDPGDGGLLGYGPVVPNPYTGEILNGWVGMYPGVMKEFINRAWDEYVDDRNQTGDAQILPVLLPIADTKKLSVAGHQFVDKFIDDFSQITNTDPDGASNLATRGGASSALGAKSSGGAKSGLIASRISGVARARQMLQNMNVQRISKAESLRQAQLSLQDYLKGATQTDEAGIKDAPNPSEVLANHGYYTADMFNFDDIVDSSIANGLKDQVPLKRWIELSEADHQKIIDVILPIVWTPVLIHEMGHNMGLRHNFAGSEDKDNWFTKEELAAQGLTREIPYSSVMDYGFKELDQLRSMGKYDVAAFNFGYNRKVDLAEPAPSAVAAHVPNGWKPQIKSITIPSGQSLTERLMSENWGLKPYGYCTDEFVGINANCRRFDEGTTLKETAQFYVKNYDKYYWRTNFRNNRRQFGVEGPTGDVAYESRISSTFRELRLFLEIYDRIDSDIPDLKPSDWKDDPFLSDLNDAATIAEDFFIRVVAQPGVMCVAAKPENIPDDITQLDGSKAIIQPIQAISPNAYDCFKDLNLTSLSDYLQAKKIGGDQLKSVTPNIMIAQAGRSWLSIKSKDNHNPWADQVNVRGMWADKIYAARALMQRRLRNSILDEHLGNFLDVHPGAAQKVVRLMEDLVSDDFYATVPFTTQDGKVIQIKTAYGLFDNAKIPPLLDDEAAYRAGLPIGDETHFLKRFLAMAHAYMKPAISSQIEDPLNDLLGVRMTTPDSPVDDKGGKLFDDGAHRYVAVPGNALAMELMSRLQLTRMLEPVNPDRLDLILKESMRLVQTSAAKPATADVKAAAPKAELTAKPEAPTPDASASPKAPDPLTEDEKALAKLPPNVLQDFIGGKFKPADRYVQILRFLGEAQSTR